MQFAYALKLISLYLYPHWDFYTNMYLTFAMHFGKNTFYISLLNAFNLMSSIPLLSPLNCRKFLRPRRFMVMVFHSPET